MTLRVYLELRSRDRYRVYFRDTILIDDSPDPELDACRALVSKGLTGKLETWRCGGTFPCMILDIGKASGLRVRDNNYGTPCFRRSAAVAELELT